MGRGVTTGIDRHRRPAVAGSRIRDMSKPLPAALSWTVLLVFAVAFAVACLAAGLPLWIPAVYLLMSIVGFVAYGVDKSAAKAGRARVSEQTLLTVGLIGGWPGALLAQQVFRHKTRKRAFKRVFWFTVVLNTAALASLVFVVVTDPHLLALDPTIGQGR